MSVSGATGTAVREGSDPHLEGVLHEPALDRERLVERQALISRCVRAAFDQDHGPHSEGRPGDAERLLGVACEREHRRVKLQIRSLEFNRKLWVRARDCDGEARRRGPVNQLSRQFRRLDRRFDVGRHAKEGIVGRVLNPLTADGGIDPREQVFRDDGTGIDVAERGDEIVDGRAEGGATPLWSVSSNAGIHAQAGTYGTDGFDPRKKRSPGSSPP